MKQTLLFAILALTALACHARIELSDVLKWGLARRAELPAEGYRMVCTTNVTPSYAWFLTGYMSSTDEGNPTVLNITDALIPGMPKELVLDGMAGLYPIPDTGWCVGPFTVEWDMTVYTGFGVLANTTDPWNGPSCWAEGFTPGANNYYCGSGFGYHYYAGMFSLTRTDYPDIVTVTTNYFATGGGAVLRDYLNPHKFGRLEDGTLRFYEVTGGVTNAL